MHREKASCVHFPQMHEAADCMLLCVQNIKEREAVALDIAKNQKVVWLLRKVSNHHMRLAGCICSFLYSYEKWSLHVLQAPA